MKALFRNILIAIGGALLLQQAQFLLDSDYIIKFLNDNLVSLLITLLAINTASLGIVLSKIREILDSGDGNGGFSSTKNAMLYSIKEQIVIIFLSLILLMLNRSKWLTAHPKFVPLIEISVITCFTFSMLILFDTAKSIFVILSFKKNG
jgi:hypothetical protein